MDTEDDDKKSHPTVVRLPPELRAALVRAAQENRRSLSKEVGARLQRSFSAEATSAFSYAREPMPPLVAEDGRPVTDHDRALVKLFHQLPPEKQLSLLTLLR